MKGYLSVAERVREARRALNKWSDVETIRLLEAVSEFPVLYANSSEGDKDRALARRHWEEIAKFFSKSTPFNNNLAYKLRDFHSSVH